MALDAGQAIASIAVMAAITFFTRALPFILFDRGKEPPKLVLYLGRVLPPAVIAMLIIYCLRNVDVFSDARGIPEIVSILVVLLLHLWKRNNLISIFGGTVLYMILVQLVFA